jgi:S1-C subfamily serine protease
VQPLPGETVYSTGYAVGLRRQTQVVGKVREVQLRYVITEPMVIPGMSGGPVVNAAGEVVSMNHMSYGSEHHQLDLGLNIQLIRQYDKVFWED